MGCEGVASVSRHRPDVRRRTRLSAIDGHAALIGVLPIQQPRDPDRRIVRPVGMTSRVGTVHRSRGLPSSANSASRYLQKLRTYAMIFQASSSLTAAGDNDTMPVP